MVYVQKNVIESAEQGLFPGFLCSLTGCEQYVVSECLVDSPAGEFED